MKKQNNYAFIDSQNLNLGVRNDVKRKGKVAYKGWHLDYKKFRRFLSDKYRVQTAFYLLATNLATKACTRTCKGWAT